MQHKLIRSLSMSVLAIFFIATQALGADLTVTKTPWCGCCSSWVEHMRLSGFDVTVHNRENLSQLKAELGVERNLQSCHTGEIDGYVIEGHVPAEDVFRLLAERPKARGLSVPGMVVGSPGMESGNQKVAYNVILIREDGSTEIYSSH